MKRIAALFGLLLLMAAPARAGTTPGKAVTVPFELLRSKHMAVKIKVNGKGPYRVIFDTGAPMLLLNTRVARESGILGRKAAAPLFSPFGAVGQMTIRKLQVGDVEADNVPTVVMDHPTVELISKVLGPIEGIVGFPFFARYTTTIDYQAKELTFVPNGYKPGDAVQNMMKAMLTAGDDRPKPKLLAPAAQWGLLVRKDEHDEDEGVTIEKVLAGSAAAAAGLRAGDRLLSLDDRWTDSLADTYEAAGHARPGTAVPLRIKRGGREVELVVKPQEGL